MGWAVGYDANWRRDIGYGVPSQCDHPRCEILIDRGLAHVCGGAPYGGDHGCGLYFCAAHLGDGQRCSRCRYRKPPFSPKSDHPTWVEHKRTDPSWQRWREQPPGDSEGRGQVGKEQR